MRGMHAGPISLWKFSDIAKLMPRTECGARYQGAVSWRLLIVLLVIDAALLFAVARRPSNDDPKPDVGRFYARLADEGLANALQDLEALARRDSVILRNGHQLAHALGRRAVEMAHFDGRVVTQCTASFASGCYHGVVEALVHARGDVDMAELERVCVTAGRAEQPGATYECIHGVGHGVLGAVGLNARDALRHCGELSSPVLLASCRSGVFMEAITAAVARSGAPGGHADHAHHGDGEQSGDTHALVVDPANPFAPCDAFQGQEARACWLFQGFVILRANRFDVRSAFETCDRAPAGQSGNCYESLGHQLAGLFQRGDNWIREQCGMGRPDVAPRCAGGAALALTGADWSGRRTAAFCAASPDPWRQTCSETGWGLLEQLASPADAASYCESMSGAAAGCTTRLPASRRPRS